MRMCGVIVMALMLTGTVRAQEPTALPAPQPGIEPALPLQPVVSEVFPLPGDPPLTATGWTAARDVSGASTATVAARGPVAAIAASSDTTLTARAPALAGRFVVSATFQRVAGSVPAAYGLSLGGAAFLIQPDGTVTMTSGARAAGAVIGVALLRSATVEGPAADRLDVEVDGATAEVRVNGARVTTVGVVPGALDGVPGVHVAAGGSVVVSAFSVEAPVEVFGAVAK